MEFEISLYQVHFVFPLSLCIVDMKGGYQSCGMYDKYFGVKCACISYYCSEGNLDNTNEQIYNFAFFTYKMINTNLCCVRRNTNGSG